MRVKITTSYNDSMLNRTVRKDEEFSVSAERAQRLVDNGVAVAISEDIADYTKRIEELEQAVADKDKRIEELEQAVAVKDKKK